MSRRSTAASPEFQAKNRLNYNYEMGQYGGRAPVYHETMDLSDYREKGAPMESLNVGIGAISPAFENMSLGSPNYNESQSTISSTTTGAKQENWAVDSTLDRKKREIEHESPRIPRKPVAPPKSNPVQTNDEDSDSDGELFREKVSFVEKKAIKLYVDQDHEKAEVYIKSLIKLLETDKRFDAKRKEWTFCLLQALEDQGKWSEIIAAVNALDPKFELTPLESEDVEFSQAEANYELGNFELARKQTNKIIKINRKMENTNLERLGSAINLMIDVVRKIGDDVDLEFYQSMLETNRQRIMQRDLNKESQPPSNDEKELAFKPDATVHNWPFETKNVPILNIDQWNERLRVLSKYGLYLGTSAREIMGADDALERAVLKAVDYGNLVLADILFDDERLLERQLPGMTYKCHVDGRWARSEIQFTFPIHRVLLSKDTQTKFKMLELLIKKGANIYSKPGSEASTMSLVLKCNAIELKALDILLRAGYPMTGTTTDTLPPLHYATLYQNSEKVTFLLNHGANVNTPDSNFGMTALTYAVANMHYNILFMENKKTLETFQTLISAGADPNLWDREGNTALHFAAKRCPVSTIRFLLTNGANPEMKNFSAEKPLDLAKSLEQSSHRREVIKLLKEKNDLGGLLARFR